MVQKGFGGFPYPDFPVVGRFERIFFPGHPSWCIRACEQEFKKEQVRGSESLTSPWCVAWFHVAFMGDWIGA